MCVIPYLLSFLGLWVVLQVGALHGSAHNGEALASLQLVGQGQQAWLLHVLLRVSAHQNQQLWSGEEGGDGRRREIQRG